MILNAVHVTQRDPLKVARYHRCVFQIALDQRPMLAVAERILDQAYTWARDTTNRDDAVNEEAQYYCPNDELEWLSTTAFNHAVDLYCSSREANARRWGRKAIELASLMRGDDGIALVSELESMYGKWLSYGAS